MNTTLLLARLMLAAIFAVAGLTKLADLKKSLNLRPATEDQ